MTEFIPVNEPKLDGNELKYVSKCIIDGWISSEGPFVKEFESKTAEALDRKYGVAVTSGTAALDTVFGILDLKPGDEVILPTFTIISCISEIIRSKATPVLVDCDPLTWNMDVSQLEEKITERTRVILVVHIYGLPVDMDPILGLAKKYGLMVIEDAAEAIGQTYRGKACGSFGDMSILSFYPNKHITTGEGGMILTDNSDFAEKSAEYRNLSFQQEKRFVHNQISYNFRMTNIQAAIGLAQLEKLSETVKIKRSNGRKYNLELNEVENIQLPLETTDYAENIYWVFGIVLDSGLNLNSEQVMKALRADNIGTRPFFWPMHEQPVLRKMGLFKDEVYPVAEKIARYGFYIPSGLTLTNKQITRVSMAVKSVVRG